MAVKTLKILFEKFFHINKILNLFSWTEGHFQ